MPLASEYWLAQQISALQKQLATMTLTPTLFNASSDGTNGWMKISANAVSGQPAIEFHYTGGGGNLLAQIYQTTGGAVQVTGGLQVSGTKNFVMAHPTVPGWVLRHASTESPVNGVEYWGEGVLGADGTAVVTLPAYFEELTHPGNRNVQLTAQGAPTSLAYDPIVAGAFTVRGVVGTKFAWLVKAERASQPGDWPIDFLAEEAGTVIAPPESAAPRFVLPSSAMIDDPGALLLPEAVDPTPVVPDPVPVVVPPAPVVPDPVPVVVPPAPVDPPAPAPVAPAPLPVSTAPAPVFLA